MVRLSVIVLIYNMEELLPRCLASLADQAMHDIQFVLVDDGSEDASGKICDEWAPKNQQVKVIHKRNEGVTAGWMDGVNAADGEYVGFVDSDDYIDAEMYEKLWSCVEQHHVDVAMCSHLYEQGEEKTPCRSMLREGIYRDREMNEVRHLVMPKLAEPYLSPSLCNKIFRRELFISNFRFCDKDVTIADDVSIVLPCLFSAKSFAYLDRPYYHYVVRGNSVTHTYKANMYEQHRLLIQNLSRAIEQYQPELPESDFAMTISAMGNQWLRMIANAGLSREETRTVLSRFYHDALYSDAAAVIDKQKINKWARAYCNVVLNHRYLPYKYMIALLNLRNSLKKR